MRKPVLGSKGRYYLLAALFASFASALVLADSFRTYESETTAIMLAKSDRAAVLLRSTVENADLLADTDPYRTRFFEELSAKSGKFDELSTSSRRETFDAMVDVAADERGSVLRIRGYADDPDDAKEISRVATLSLFRFLGQYYNVKEDVDFRIAGGPTTVSGISHMPSFVLSSVALGVLSTSILFLALWALPRVFALSGGRAVSRKPLLDAGVFEPSRPMSPYFDQAPMETSVSPREPFPSAPPMPTSMEEPLPMPPVPAEPAPAHIKSASAPVNLPSLSEAEEQFLREFSFEGSLEEEGTDEAREAVRTGAESVVPAPEPEAPRDEPTEAEYKRRLNELLRG